MALPVLRDELRLSEGPALRDGQPTWTLHDPARNLFFRLDWMSMEILSRWSLDAEDAILESIKTGTTLTPSRGDITDFARFLADNQLVQPRGLGSAAALAARRARGDRSAFSWLLHHYLFFRLPLVRPDAWLGRWMHVAAMFRSGAFLSLTLAALLVGVHQIARQWESFISSLVDTFSLSGLLSYGFAIFLVKVCHELGHAFTAKQSGCRVPTMGIAFLVMWPVAYTDTNETWRLRDRRQRLQVASAGIVTELVIAAWASCAWAFLPDGGLRSAAFVLATTSWVTTLAINASPFMRFDGYFLLSDWLDIPNLHDRSFALARWRLREWLFGLGEPRPEYFRPRLEKGLILFAWLTWTYRLIVFLGIALLVYYLFFKALGILLFVVEIGWFIAMPLRNEIREWIRRWPAIRQRRRYRRGVAAMCVLLLLSLVPWPGRVAGSGILRPVDIWPVYAPGGAQLVQLPFAEGSTVRAGETILTLRAPELEARRRSALATVESLRWQAVSADFDPRTRARAQSSREALATAEAELASIDEELSRFAPRAPFDGFLRDIDPDLSPSEWVSDGEQIALLAGSGESLVETWLDEESVKRIRVGDRAFWFADGGAGPLLRLRVTNIDTDSTRALRNGLVAASAGGNVLVREAQGQVVPEHAVYRVTLHVESQAEALHGHTWRGRTVIFGKGEAPAARYLRAALAVLVREAGW